MTIKIQGNPPCYWNHTTHYSPTDFLKETGMISRESKTEMLYPCSNRWGPPVHHHQSPGSPLLALGVENLPGLAESHLHDHVALVCVGRSNSREVINQERRDDNSVVRKDWIWTSGSHSQSWRNYIKNCTMFWPRRSSNVVLSIRMDAYFNNSTSKQWLGGSFINLKWHMNIKGQRKNTFFWQN